jgi:hypothetical protein
MIVYLPGQEQKMKRLIVGCSAVVAGILLISGSPAFAATSTQLSVESTGFFGGFTDLAVVSAADGWAVGGNGNGTIERFNGTRWALVPSPDLLNGDANNWAGLDGVSSTSATNAFAVGKATTAATGDAAVALRWNGTAWSQLTVPSATGPTSAFDAVKAFSASDAWAVGTTGSSFGGQTLAMHFNGSTWSQSATPSPGTRDNILTSVAGSGPNDVWAVGYFRNQPYGNRIRQPMTLHWNGTTWSQVASPESGAGQSTYLYDVAVTSPTDAWAVGYGTVGGQLGAFVEHWNGTAWSTATALPMGTLRSVSARSATDVWVAGDDTAGAPAVAHWNGSAWSVTPVTVTGGVGIPLLASIAVVDANTEWAAGYQWEGTTGQSSGIAFRVAN